MTIKKKTTFTQEESGENKNPYKSYFMDKIFPSFVTLAIGAIGALVVAYFTLLSLNTRVSALEGATVKKDVFIEVIVPIKEDVSEIKEQAIEINKKIDRILEK